MIRIEGSVAPRPEGTENAAIPTGGIEVLVSSLEVLKHVQAPAFPARRARYRRGAERDPQIQISVPGYAPPEGAGDVYPGGAVRRWQYGIPHLAGLFRDRDGLFSHRHTPRGHGIFTDPSRLNPGQFYALPQFTPSSSSRY